MPAKVTRRLLTHCEGISNDCRYRCNRRDCRHCGDYGRLGLCDLRLTTSLTTTPLPRPRVSPTRVPEARAPAHHLVNTVYECTPCRVHQHDVQLDVPMSGSPLGVGLEGLRVMTSDSGMATNLEAAGAHLDVLWHRAEDRGLHDALDWRQAVATIEEIAESLARSDPESAVLLTDALRWIQTGDGSPPMPADFEGGIERIRTVVHRLRALA
jgi:hypothetical protein